MHQEGQCGRAREEYARQALLRDSAEATAMSGRGSPIRPGAKGFSPKELVTVATWDASPLPLSG